VRRLRASILDGLADLTLVTHTTGRPSGYITGRVEDDGASLSIGLFGVAAQARGRGSGSTLVSALLRAPRGARHVDVVMQGRNVPAQRLYQAAGFRTAKTEVWFHRWASTRDNGSSGSAGAGAAVTAPLR
jgi:ribosomal protein S18 acetylase RimI-like enzyme